MELNIVIKIFLAFLSPTRGMLLIGHHHFLQIPPDASWSYL